MSLRVLRKLQEKQKLENAKSDEILKEDAKDESEESEDDSPPMQHGNRFDLLNGDSHSETETKGRDESSEDICNSASQKLSHAENYAASSLYNKTGARKKKKKMKKSGRSKRTLSVCNENKSDTDEIEKCVREVNAILGETDNSFNLKDNDCHKPVRNLMRVEYKHLNPQNEMKRIFGARIVQANEGKRRNSRKSGRGARATRGTFIVQPRPQWNEHSKSGISMHLETTDEKTNLFRFCHNSSYQQIQEKFLEAVRSYDPENIIRLLNEEPFHVDTLLQVSEIFRLADDSSMAAQLIERVIYVLESIAHPLFSITSGNCRMEYKRQENRGFFIALFRHILTVGNKGCYRTALELCKLLLSLAPEDDPLAVSLMIDFFAIRSQEYQWLVDVYDYYEPTRNLSMLPNFAYSVPLALYYLSVAEHGPEKGQPKGYSKNLGASSADELRGRADRMLQDAILKFPSVVRPLLEKCNVQMDDVVDGCTFLKLVSQSNIHTGLDQLIKLYIGRSFHLWKVPEVISWLEDNLKTCTKQIKFDENDQISDLLKFQDRYQGTPLAIMRHIIISEIKDVKLSLPPSLANQPMMSYDPLPPVDSICDYSFKTRTPESPNLLSTFLRALMPEYDPTIPEYPRREADVANLNAGGVDGPDLGAAGLGSLAMELSSNVQTLLEAIRNLFTSINLAETATAGDADDSEDETASDDNDDEWNE